MTTVNKNVYDDVDTDGPLKIYAKELNMKEVDAMDVDFKSVC